VPDGSFEHYNKQLDDMLPVTECTNPYPDGLCETADVSAIKIANIVNLLQGSDNTRTKRSLTKDGKAPDMIMGCEQDGETACKDGKKRLVSSVCKAPSFSGYAANQPNCGLGADIEVGLHAGSKDKEKKSNLQIKSSGPFSAKDGPYDQCAEVQYCKWAGAQDPALRDKILVANRFRAGRLGVCNDCVSEPALTVGWVNQSVVTQCALEYCTKTLTFEQMYKEQEFCADAIKQFAIKEGLKVTHRPAP